MTKPADPPHIISIVVAPDLVNVPVPVTVMLVALGCQSLTLLNAKVAPLAMLTVLPLPQLVPGSRSSSVP